MQSLPITTKVVSSNPVHGEVYSIQHYVIKFVSDLRQVVGFLRYSGFLHQENWPPPYTCSWNIVESGINCIVEALWCWNGKAWFCDMITLSWGKHHSKCMQCFCLLNELCILFICYKYQKFIDLIHLMCICVV